VCFRAAGLDVTDAHCLRYEIGIANNSAALEPDSHRSGTPTVADQLDGLTRAVLGSRCRETFTLATL
jgi:hypothetical protein